MHVITVDFAINKGHEAAFLQRMRQQASDSLEREEGCLQFDVCIDPADPGRIFLYEVYTDEDAFKLHLASDHFLDFDRTVADWVAEKKVGAWRRDG